MNSNPTPHPEKQEEDESLLFECQSCGDYTRDIGTCFMCEEAPCWRCGTVQSGTHTCKLRDEIKAMNAEAREEGKAEGREEERERINSILPNDDIVREWQEHLAPEADREWYASGACRMRIKIRQLLSPSKEV